LPAKIGQRGGILQDLPQVRQPLDVPLEVVAAANTNSRRNPARVCQIAVSAC